MDTLLAESQNSLFAAWAMDWDLWKVGRLLLVGLLAGALARFIMPGKDPASFLMTLVLGVAGALLGGLVAGYQGVAGGDLPSEILIATAGSFVLLLIYRIFVRRQ